jgi:hypothetical protein
MLSFFAPMNQFANQNTNAEGPALSKAAASGGEQPSTEEGWAHSAYEFLLHHARNHRSFLTHEVSTSLEQAGLQGPGSERDWGPVYRRAAQEGVIAIAGMEVSDDDGVFCTRWRSKIASLPD